jgi:hypothetical protein
MLRFWRFLRHLGSATYVFSIVPWNSTPAASTYLHIHLLTLRPSKKGIGDLAHLLGISRLAVAHQLSARPRQLSRGFVYFLKMARYGITVRWWQHGETQ